jgi:hypothetical protein
MQIAAQILEDALRGIPLRRALMDADASMKKKCWWQPFDPKTSRAVFTPVLRAIGERLDLEVNHATFPRSSMLGYHGDTQDLKSGRWYAVFGKECDIPGCNCDQQSGREEYWLYLALHRE